VYLLTRAVRRAGTAALRHTDKRETGQLRELHVAVNFKRGAADELRAALGAYAGQRLEISFRFAPIEALRTKPPA